MKDMTFEQFHVRWITATKVDNVSIYGGFPVCRDAKNLLASRETEAWPQ